MDTPEPDRRGAVAARRARGGCRRQHGRRAGAAAHLSRPAAAARALPAPPRRRDACSALQLLQGGIGPAGLATDDLYVLDLAGTPRWHRVVRLLRGTRGLGGPATASADVHPPATAQVVQGPGPGARYAHVLALVGQRFLLVLGGNDGYKARAPPGGGERRGIAVAGAATGQLTRTLARSRARSRWRTRGRWTRR